MKCQTATVLTDTNDRIVFMHRLKALRTARGLTQTQLADHAGISARTVVRLERSQRSPRAATAEALAGALHVPRDAIFDKFKGEQ